MTLNKQVFLVSGLLVLLWTSCLTDSKQNAKILTKDTTRQITTLAEIRDSLLSKTVTFKIDPTKDTLIKCQKGTMIFMPANALEFPNGSSPTGQVKVNIKECYTISDFIGDNLTTTSGDRILETGGMVNISVSSDGKALKMKDGKEYKLYFPRNGKQGDMQLFYGNHDQSGKMDWTLAPSSETKGTGPKSESGLIDKSLYSCKIKISGYQAKINNYDVKWNMKEGKQTIFDYFSDNFSPSDKMKNEFCSRNYRVEFYIKLDVSGKVSEIRFTQSSRADFDKKIADFFYAMPPLDVTTMAKHTPDQEYVLDVTGQTDIDRGKYNEQFKKKYASFRDRTITKIDKEELNYYVQTATKFGWINCDRFWNTADEKIEFCVNTQSPNETTIIIAFKDINSVMRGTLKENGFVFPNIPINQAVKVIGISFENGKPRMGVAETMTDKDGFKLTDFKELSLKDLETELNKMN